MKRLHAICCAFLACSASLAYAQASEPWYDTDRLVLRNGNIVDGKIIEQTDEIVVIQWDPSSTAQILREDIDRIEKLNVRMQQAPVVEKPVDKPSTETGPVKPPPGGTEKPLPVGPSPKTAGEIKKRIDEILEKIPDADRKRRETLALEIRSFGVEGARYLIWRLPTLDEARLSWAVETVRTMGDFRIEPELRELLASPLPALRTVAASMLGDRGDKDSLPRLMSLLRDETSSVRAAAATSVGRLGDAFHLAPLVDVTIDPDNYVRRCAIEGAAALAKRLSIEGTLAQRWVDILPRAPEKARAEIPQALAKLGAGKDSGSFPVEAVRERLIGLLTSDSSAEVRMFAVYALGELRYREAVPLLLERLTAEREPRVVGRIAEALAKTGSPEAVRPLIDLLNSSVEDVRLSAARALRQITGQAALGPSYDQWMNWYQQSRPK